MGSPAKFLAEIRDTDHAHGVAVFIPEECQGAFLLGGFQTLGHFQDLDIFEDLIVRGLFDRAKFFGRDRPAE